MAETLTWPDWKGSRIRGSAGLDRSPRTGTGVDVYIMELTGFCYLLIGPGFGLGRLKILGGIKILTNQVK